VAKILAQTGNSLADIYNVLGSIAGIEDLDTRTLPIVHEMGGTAFSERLSGAVRRITTGDILENVSWEVKLTNLPTPYARVLSLIVMADTANRVTTAQVSIENGTQTREVPIYAWSSASDASISLRINDDGAVAVFNLLRPAVQLQGMPALIIQQSIPSFAMGNLVFRGLTSGFGAGTVEVVAVVNVAFPFTAGLNSRGLPIPSW